MKKLYGLIFLFILLQVHFCNGQSVTGKISKKITVSAAIEKQVDSCLKLNPTDASKAIEGQEVNSRIYLKIYDGTRSVVNSETSKDGTPIICRAAILNDTLHIEGRAGFNSGYGFYIQIHGDYYSAVYFAYTEYEMYKLKASEKFYQRSVDAPATYQKLVLNQKPGPELKKIKGYIELRSCDFVENGAEGLKTYQGEVKAYFSCDVFKY